MAADDSGIYSEIAIYVLCISGISTAVRGILQRAVMVLCVLFTALSVGTCVLLGDPAVACGRGGTGAAAAVAAAAA